MQQPDQQTILYRHVGARIRERRRILRITQGRLAEILNISYQQVQKYETGINQLSLSRMLQFAKVLNVAPSYFYEGIAFDDGIGAHIESDVIQRTRTKPISILLVEDTLADALLFSNAIKELENLARVHCISDAEMAKSHLQSNAGGKPAPDIIILDLNLPKINGLQLLKEIKTNSQTSIIPTLILTNSISKKEMMEAYRLGAAGFIQKSIDYEEYKEAIETAVLYWSKIVALPVK